MTARDELQQWVDDIPDGVLTSTLHKTINAELARRLLEEMDADVVKAAQDGYREGVLHRRDYNRVAAERDAALAKLDAVRAWAQNGEAYIRGGQRKELFRILDGEGDA